MRCVGRLAIFALALPLGVGSGLSPARAGDPVADEPAFLASLASAKADLAVGRAGDGLDIVQKALEAHRGKDYVRGRRAEVEDLVRRICFRKECAPPDPKTLVKGDLRKFVSTTGDLEIHYKSGQPSDLQPRGDGLVFPARFRGPFTISVRGDAYPTTADATPVVTLGMEENPQTHRAVGWGVVFGCPPYDVGNQKVWLPSRIVAVDGTAKKTVVEKATSSARPGHAYRCDAAMTSTSVTGSIDGASFGSAPKPDGVYGFAMVKATGWTEIVVTGIVEPSWIQGKVDAIVDKSRAAFDAKFDVRQVLPAWLYAAGPAAGPAASPPAPALRMPAGLRDLPPALLADYLAAVAKLRAGDARAALDAATALRAKGAPDSATGVLAAQALLALEEPARALAEADRALAADPDAFDAFVVKGYVLLRLGRRDELAVAAKAAVARPGADAEVSQVAGCYLLLAGRLDDALAVSEDAARRGWRSPGLEALGRVAVRAKNGPDWPKSYEYRTNNYHVVSDIDLDTCRRAALLLEDAFLEYRVHVRPVKAEERRLYKVYLFSGEAGFKRYQSDSEVFEGKGPERAAGLYSRVLKQLLIWNLPNRDEMLRTIRHEGFHQYLDRVLADPPVWFNEGMAVYFEPLPHPGGDADTPRPDMTDRLKDGVLVPLKEFLHVTPKEFYAASPRSYAQAWLLVHMLRHGASAHRDLYAALLSRLETSTGPEAVRAVFPDESLPALDLALRAHLAEQSRRK